LKKFVALLMALVMMIGLLAGCGMLSKDGEQDSEKKKDSGKTVACTNLVLSDEKLYFYEGVDSPKQYLGAKAEPENTTDTVKYVAEDTSVVMVNNDGWVTVVGEGTTNIFVICGNITKSCTVTVLTTGTGTPGNTENNENNENTGNTEDKGNSGNQTGTQNPPVSGGTIRFNRKDMTLSQKGATWNLYSGDVAKNLVTFTSEDTAVVTIVDGVVTAVGPNHDGVWVHAEYNGQKISCLVRCSFKGSSDVVENGGVSEDGGSAGTMGTVMDGINVRSGPGLSYGTIGTLLSGDRVTVTERRQGDGYEWGKIIYGNGTGWIVLHYVKMD